MLERIDLGVGGGERNAGPETCKAEVVEVAHGFGELLSFENTMGTTAPIGLG